MNIGIRLIIVAVVSVLGGLIAPAFAQNGSGNTQSAPEQEMGSGRMGRSMMHGGMMSRGMMAGGCSQMMQSMNSGGEGRPNGQWQKHPEHPNNGG